VELIDQVQLSELEPEAVSCTGRALHIPITAVFDPKEILARLAEQLAKDGVQIFYNTPVTRIQPQQKTLYARNAAWHYGYLINTAGLYADKVAQRFGLSRQYGMLPFKGIYYELSPSSALRINGLIYPVPDLNMPFLGVHFTRTVTKKVYLGPSALPALGREHYHGLSGISASELPTILSTLADFYLNNRQHFRQFAHVELSRLMKPAFVNACQAMVPRISLNDVKPSRKVGIRAQLVNLKKKELVTDFLVEHDEQSLHILNAVSPAFTSAFSFARHVLDSYVEKRVPQGVS
jgi:L-2-hydroxyglutarate oxidase LhgO